MKSKVLGLKLENKGENEKVVKIFNKVDVRSWKSWTVLKFNKQVKILKIPGHRAVI